jgi:hypothetical protein
MGSTLVKVIERPSDFRLWQIVLQKSAATDLAVGP